MPDSVPGPNSISLAPGFVNAAGEDFRLGRVAAGQPTDSAVIDGGSELAAALGLGSRTAFTDRYPDTGPVDLGYHGVARGHLRIVGRGQWIFTNGDGTITATRTRQPDPSVAFRFQAASLTFTMVTLPTCVTFRVGDDYNTSSVLLQGTLQMLQGTLQIP